MWLKNGKKLFDRTENIAGRGENAGLCGKGLSLLPNDKMLDLSKLKAFADDTLNMPQMTKFVYDRIENIVEKGENAGYQHFLLFPANIFCSLLPQRGLYGKELKSCQYVTCFRLIFVTSFNVLNYLLDGSNTF